MRVPAAALVLALLLAPTRTTAAEATTADAERYREPAARLLGRALVDQGAWSRLEYLTTRIGNRLSGSPTLEQAIAWAREAMQEDGLEEVRLQPVKVPRWVRGTEWARVTAPVERELPILGLGMSVGTPPGGLTARVVVVRSFEELQALGRARVEGRIVAFAPEWEGYGRTVRYRFSGASAAARLGAVAALVRSATSRSIASPHTGMLGYEAGVPQIPAASITVEDAEWLERMAKAGETVTVSLSMQAHLEGEVDSSNVLAEVRGSEKPQEVVVMGGHLDSWDVGQGAHDDGCSCMAAWEALRIVHELGLRPRRTLRVALWVSEENSGNGGRAYRAALGDQVASHVAAIEMDGGCERPTGFGLTTAAARAEDVPAKAALARLRDIASLLT
ncbi:MAG TPA: M20/M25/M40 family metallo-hydrolase, partial [Vicinamibacteria bacterium]|nr:M20/M25/M40 family metallo-hydrolase [Vicinamibacteria bacterium]